MKLKWILIGKWCVRLWPSRGTKTNKTLLSIGNSVSSVGRRKIFKGESQQNRIVLLRKVNKVFYRRYSFVWRNQRKLNGGGGDKVGMLHTIQQEGIWSLAYFLQVSTLEGALDIKFYKQNPYYLGAIFVAVHQYNYSGKIIPIISELGDPQRFLSNLRKWWHSVFKRWGLNWGRKVG